MEGARRRALTDQLAGLGRRERTLDGEHLEERDPDRVGDGSHGARIGEPSRLGDGQVRRTRILERVGEICFDNHVSNYISRKISLQTPRGAL
jgi:hypothetical protein